MSGWFPGLSGSRYPTRAQVQKLLEISANQAVTEALALALQQLDDDTLQALSLKANQTDLVALELRVDDAEAAIIQRALQSALTTLAGRVTVNEGDILALQNNAALDSDLTALAGRVTTAEGDIIALEGRMDGAEGDILGLDAGKQNKGDPVLGTVQALTGAGAASLTDLVTTLTTDAATQAVTLADGAAGQVKVIALAAQLDPLDVATVTPTTATGFTSIDLTAPGQSVTLIWAGGWIITANNGATIT